MEYVLRVPIGTVWPTAAFLPEKTVIGKEDNDRIIRMAAPVQSVKQSPDLLVSESHRSMIGLDASLPVIALLPPRMGRRQPVERNAFGNIRKVIPIVGLDWRQMEGCVIDLIKDPLRSIPRHVRPVEAHR